MSIKDFFPYRPILIALTFVSFTMLASPSFSRSTLELTNIANSHQSTSEHNSDFYDTLDPLEGFNQIMFEFNSFLDAVFLVPSAYLYKNILPPYLQDRIHGFVSNLSYPLTMVNDLLQFDFDALANDTGRFLINTIFGIFGLFDIATEIGLERNQAGFGSTLRSWNIETGPYLVLPLIGPSSFRGIFGLVFDYFADPVSILTYKYQTDANTSYYFWGIQTVDEYASNYDYIQHVKETSLDLYSTLRSLYFQNQLSDPDGDDLSVLDSIETPLPD